MEGLQSQKKMRQMVSPKVTQTTVTSIKATPFPILRHHMDGTQMKEAFGYEQSQLPKLYVYEGEVRRLCRTPIKESPYSPRSQEVVYSPRHIQPPSPRHIQPYSPRINSSAHRRMGSDTDRNDSSDDGSYGLKQSKSTKVNEDIRKIAKVTRKLKEEADRYRDICKQKMRNEMKDNDTFDDLEKDIKKLKLNNLHLEREKLEGQLRKKERADVSYNNKYYYKSSGQDRRQIWNQILCEKPRYKGSMDPNTDSEFSSFEL